MFAVGKVNSQRAAQAFCDYLKTQGIESSYREEQTFQIISVHQQQWQDRVIKEFEDFLANPSDPKYIQASWLSGDLKPATKSTSNPTWQYFLLRAGKITQILAIVSIVITLFTGFGENRFFGWFTFEPSLILQGQIYRLITPIFVHFTVMGVVFLHLLFNLMWLWDFGGQLEKRLGSFWMVYFVAITALISNTAQYLVSGSSFGGMSGVVYGLLGYFWIRGEIDPSLGLKLNRVILIFLLVWLAMGFVGMIGSVANAAHLLGLLSGMTLAFLDVKVFRFKPVMRE